MANFWISFLLRPTFRAKKRAMRLASIRGVGSFKKTKKKKNEFFFSSSSSFALMMMKDVSLSFFATASRSSVHTDELKKNEKREAAFCQLCVLLTAFEAGSQQGENNNIHQTHETAHTQKTRGKMLTILSLFKVIHPYSVLVSVCRFVIKFLFLK